MYGRALQPIRQEKHYHSRRRGALALRRLALEAACPFLTIMYRGLQDYYQTLGIPRGSSDVKAMKTAYRQLARKYHPVRRPS